jgi:hypothetical protein
MALPNLSGSNIQDTFHRVLHTDGTEYFDGTGSVVPIVLEDTSPSFTNGLFSGDIAVKGDISASGVINAHRFMAVGVPLDSIYSTLSSPVFIGTPTFNGPITASSGISASGEIIANELTLDDDINLKVDSTINFASNTTANAGQITYAESTDELMLAAQYTNLTLNKNTGLIFNELAHIGGGFTARDFRVEGYGDTHLFFISGSANKIGIGTSTPGEKLTVVGNISSSGTITATSFVGNMDGGIF